MFNFLIFTGSKIWGFTISPSKKSIWCGSFLAGKDFKFYLQEPNEDCIQYNFAQNRNTTNDAAESFITLRHCPSSKAVYFQTSNKELLGELLYDAAKAQFKYKETLPEEDDMLHVYESDKQKLLVLSRKSSNGVTVYQFSLENK